MTKELIQTPDGETITLTISDDGYCFCPVCGEQAKNKDWRPYDNMGYPSYDICSCGFEFGFDDGGVPPYHKSWKNYRDRWLNGEIESFNSKSRSKSEKLAQLKNIGG